MASNLQKTSALLEQTALNVTKSPEAWMAFLNTAPVRAGVYVCGQTTEYVHRVYEKLARLEENFVKKDGISGEKVLKYYYRRP